jgi:hypothetical protein
VVIGRLASARVRSAFFISILAVSLFPSRGWRADTALAAAATADPEQQSVLGALQSSGELVVLAEAVVRGTILNADSYWSIDRSMIYTRYRVRVDSEIVGKVDPVIDVAAVGGRVGETTLRVSGSADLIPGAQYLLLLGDEPGYRCVLGGAQGRFLLKPEDAQDKTFDSVIARAVEEIRSGVSHESR